jgi:hypothetical protein
MQIFCTDKDDVCTHKICPNAFLVFKKVNMAIMRKFNVLSETGDVM